MTTERTDDALDVLACEFEKRPTGAPSFSDLRHAVRGVRYEDGALTVVYDPEAAVAVEQLAAAERFCCPTIGFDVTHAPAPTLRIRATPAQLDIFRAFLTS